MSNPQDSPKTLEELVDLLRRIYNPGAWTQRQLDSAVQEIQSYIDAQKAEITEEWTEPLAFAHQIGGIELNFGWQQRVSQLIATRDQKLVQEAVKPCEELIKQVACQHENTRGGNDYLLCDDCGLEWDYRSQYGLEHALRKAARALLSQPTAPLMEGDSAVKPFIAALVWALPHLEDQATNWENEYVYDSPDDTGRLGDAAEYALNKLSATKRLLLNYADPLAVADIPLETRPFVIVEGDPNDPSRSTVQVIFTDPDALLSQPLEVK